ncbi:phosphate ABC transporter permease PstA [Halomonas shantousis]
MRHTFSAPVTVPAKRRSSSSQGREGVWPWLSAAGVALSLLMVLALLTLLAGRGLAHFWPAPVELVTLADGSRVAGSAVREEERVADGVAQTLYRTGNRDLDGEVWRWVAHDAIVARQTPPELAVVSRTRWSEFIGRVVGVLEDGKPIVAGNHEDSATATPWQVLQARLARVEALRERRDALRETVIAPRVRELEALSEEHGDTPDRRIQALQTALAEASAEVMALQSAMARDTVVLESVAGRRVEQSLSEVLSAYRPNAMSEWDKMHHWVRQLWAFLSQGPRAGNTAGGVWPAIFGTVLMVMLMSLLVTPFGVLAAIYLNEVARQGAAIRLVRIAVRNLAGVPSIVYGVFGLGVFVYGIGGQLDRWFFDDRLPSPTFGTGGILWASLTLALLTLPVVIVATEEGLARIPTQLREGSLALGATRVETLRRVVLPMALPAMLTGVILAVARAAGEVAPLMLVGVAKLAPDVPLDGEFPFLHLDRKFMHLGYHLFDLSFSSRDVEAALPLVYATALLLVGVIGVLNLTAIFLRHHLRVRYRVLEH